MILIYSDSQVCDIEWIPHIRWPDKIQICQDINWYTAADCAVKIAFSAHRLSVDRDSDMYFENKVRLLSDHSRLVFTIESELHPYHDLIWAQCHRPNVYWLLPGSVNDREEINQNIIYWGDWFKTTVALYRHLPDVIDNLHTKRSKAYRFEALLGSPKPHRQFVAQSVTDNDLQSHFILTYGGQWSTERFYAHDYFIWEPDTEMIDPDAHIGTMDWARYRGHQCHLSQIIPVGVYNDSYYSIVAETDYLNNPIFFSEKTVKPILAKRLFVVFSGYRFLRQLRNLGFQTFDGIIDESYDLMPDANERWTAAFDQVKLLCQTEPDDILRMIQPIIDHNYQLMVETDWTDRARKDIQRLIDSATILAQA